MSETDSTANELAIALSLAQSELAKSPPRRNCTNPRFQSKYADLSSLLETAIPILAKHGLAVLQVIQWGANVMLLKTLLVHGKSGQSIESHYPIASIERLKDPQLVGSLLSYAKRYSLGSLIGCGSADVDDDANHASDAKPTGFNERQWIAKEARQ
jgi:hypothetical protein